MQLGEDGHTAGAQLVLAINSKLPLNLFNTHPGLGSVCGLRKCIIMAAAPSLSGNPGENGSLGADGGFEIPVGGSVEFGIWRSGLGGAEGPRWGSSREVPGPERLLAIVIRCAGPERRGGPR